MTEQQIIETLATKVMGWKVKNGYLRVPKQVDGYVLLEAFWNPLQNIADAWQVVEKISNNGNNVELTRRSDGMCFCHIRTVGHVGCERIDVLEKGKTAHEAICNAALKVVSTK